MKDQGLSIFDDEPDDVDAPETDPSAQDTADGGHRGREDPGHPGGRQSAGAQAGPGAAREAAGDPSVARSGGSAPSPTPARPSHETNGGTPTFPMVRRNGYDPSAVDNKVRPLTGEKAGLTASLTEAEQR